MFPTNTNRAAKVANSPQSTRRNKLASESETPTSTNASNEPNLPTEGASRIPFAPNEQTRNADNYDAAVALLGAGGDKFGTRLWWDVKTDKPAW